MMRRRSMMICMLKQSKCKFYKKKYKFRNFKPYSKLSWFGINTYTVKSRYEAQMKEFKEKGYYTMEDGTKSTDVQIGAKKKRAERSEQKPSGKRKSAMDKSKSAKKGGSAKKPAKNTKKTEQSDELDIESEEESANNEESQQVEDSDWRPSRVRNMICFGQIDVMKFGDIIIIEHTQHHFEVNGNED
jgi:hypothetical protein